MEADDRPAPVLKHLTGKKGISANAVGYERYYFDHKSWIRLNYDRILVSSKALAKRENASFSGLSFRVGGLQVQLRKILDEHAGYFGLQGVQLIVVREEGTEQQASPARRQYPSMLLKYLGVFANKSDHLDLAAVVGGQSDSSLAHR
jgi:hypothetical protein